MRCFSEGGGWLSEAEDGKCELEGGGWLTEAEDEDVF